MTNSLDGTVSRVDARRAIVADTIPVGAAPNGVAVAPDGVWVTNEVSGTLVHLDQAAGKTTVDDARRAAGGPDLSRTARSGSPCRPPAPPTAAAP